MSKNILLKKYIKDNSGHLPVEGCFPFPFSVFSRITAMSMYHLNNRKKKKKECPSTPGTEENLFYHIT